MSTILKVENLSKQYRLGLVGTGTLRHDLNRFWHRVRGKEDPYLKVGAVNDRSVKATQNYVWALQDINFDVQQGDVLGIIGKNGAGKSTLLKILSRVTSPTTGSIKTKGRIASLLEVGTGFHPELTGKENIYLNGAILGMTKSEITEKLDDIVAFSGCNMYIDTPVKRYSSGMRVRLAFAVAAHLEPDILIVDEVLAVGDAEFQKKAVGKMQDISKSEGRTVLFVSHNMAAVKSLCTRAIVLENGSTAFMGSTDESVEYYLKRGSSNYLSNHHVFKHDIQNENPFVKVIELFVSARYKDLNSPILRSDALEFVLELEKKIRSPIGVVLRFKDDEGNYLFVSTNNSKSYDDATGILHYSMLIPSHFFNEGNFFVDLLISYRKEAIFIENDAIQFTIVQEAKKIGKWMGKTKGALKPEFEWSINTTK